jgi:hypothetical protein
MLEVNVKEFFWTLGQTPGSEADIRTVYFPKKV